MKKWLVIIALFSLAQVSAQTRVHFPNPSQWTANELAPYVGQTITFEQPVYICNNYYSSPTVSLHRVMSPTNQELPGSPGYNNLLTLNSHSEVTLTGLSDYHRMGEVFGELTAYVSSTSSLSYVSHKSLYGTRDDLLEVASVDMRD